MLARVVLFTLLLSAGDTVLAMSYAFRLSVSGRLDAPIIFAFYRDSTARVKTDIESFGVAVLTRDHEWKPVWSIYEGRPVTQPIQYGLPPPGFTTRIAPERLHSGRVYTAFASDGHGGHATMYFRFQKDGAITFPDSPRLTASNQALERTADRRENLLTMTSALKPEAQLALVSGRSAYSR